MNTSKIKQSRNTCFRRKSSHTIPYQSYQSVLQVFSSSGTLPPGLSLDRTLSHRGPRSSHDGSLGLWHCLHDCGWAKLGDHEATALKLPNQFSLSFVLAHTSNSNPLKRTLSHLQIMLISISSSRCSTWSPQTGETSPQLFFHSCWSTTQSVHRVNAIYIYSICIHIYIYMIVYTKKHREKTDRTVASLAPGDQLLNQGLIPSPPRWGSRYSGDLWWLMVV